jgi:hypothetical protein
MINSAKVQLDYYALTKQTKSIPFLDKWVKHDDVDNWGFGKR